jgi:type II secretory pathway component PulM
MIELLKQWWGVRAARERVILVVLALLLLAAVLITGLWQPLKKRERAHIERIEALTADFGYLMSQKSSLLKVAGNSESSNESPLSTLERELKQARLDGHIEQLSPQGALEVRVAMADVSFDAIIDLLESLESRFGLRTTSFSARKAQPGAVDVEWTSTQGMP